MNIVYLTIEQALAIHKKTIEISGGGEDGVLDAGKLDSVLEHIQNDDYYPSFEDKLTHLCFCVDNFHCFVDGNKRLSISLGMQFLLFNGYVFVAKRFINEMENISYHVASGKIDKELLREIICALIYDEFEEEELKLKILKAITE